MSVTAARRFALWFAGTISVALAGWGAVAAAQYALDRWRPPPPPISEQQTAVVREAARSGLRVVESYEADLRGGGGRSRILVLRRKRSQLGARDELWIYDVSDGRLRLRLGFAPAASGSGLHPDIEIRLAEVADIDSNGSAEILMALDQNYVEHFTSSPALVSWDPVTDTYRIGPLLTPDSPSAGGSTRPRISSPEQLKLSAFLSPAFLYADPVRIRDAASGTSFRSFSAADFVVRREKFANHLLVAFLIGSDKRGVVFQLNAWTIADLAFPPLLYPCTTSEQKPPRILFHLRGDEELTTALVRVWASSRDSLSC